MFKTFGLRDYIISAIFAGIISIMGYVIIPLPFSPVPITGQTFAIMLIGLTLSTTQAGLSVVIFILLGVVGIPVFSGGTSGVQMLVSPKGGYIIGFLVGAMVISLIRRQSNNPVRMAAAGFIGGILVVYTFGVLWLSYVNKLPITKAIIGGALPFIPLDLFKLFLAVTVALAVNRQLKAVLIR